MQKNRGSEKLNREAVCGDSPLASQRGVEPPAYCLGGSRSILLSYWDIFYILPYPVPFCNRFLKYFIFLTINQTAGQSDPLAVWHYSCSLRNSDTRFCMCSAHCSAVDSPAMYCSNSSESIGEMSQSHCPSLSQARTVSLT